MSETKAPSIRLPPKMEMAARLLADGVTQTKAAGHPDIRVTKQTMTRWCKRDDLRDRIEQLRTDLDHQAREILEGGQMKAAQTIVDAACGSLDEDPKVLNARLKAALYILDFLKVKKLPKRKDRIEQPIDELTEDEVDDLLSRE
ncbi:hypothetical protein LCGC14_1657170 [marine sediment metagenome]|uniref:Homeodomain phBC6A51-type domain-containing protein n=1 Tax=marine sediment metagenome TaxID=412755 RepID=A0A0F9IHJ6_9ZZZZ